MAVNKRKVCTGTIFDTYFDEPKPGKKVDIPNICPQFKRRRGFPDTVNDSCCTCIFVENRKTDLEDLLGKYYCVHPKARHTPINE